jgi:hypothetical protein
VLSASANSLQPLTVILTFLEQRGNPMGIYDVQLKKLGIKQESEAGSQKE